MTEELSFRRPRRSHLEVFRPGGPEVRVNDEPTIGELLEYERRHPPLRRPHEEDPRGMPA